MFDIQGRSLDLSGVTIANGRADVGAGLRNQGGRLALAGVVLRDNRARLFGGGLYNDGIASLDRVQVTGNAASLGGGIANLGRLSTRRVTFGGNRSAASANLFDRGKTGRGPAGPRVLTSPPRPGRHPG